MSSREKLWTPGPWDNKEITICDQDLIGISFSFLNTANRGRYEEGVANGRLMKAAPDLVDAGEQLFAEFESLCNVIPALRNSNAYIDMKKAIDKAYGDSQ